MHRGLITLTGYQASPDANPIHYTNNHILFSLSLTTFNTQEQADPLHPVQHRPCFDYISWLPFIRAPSYQLPFTTTFRLLAIQQTQEGFLEHHHQKTHGFNPQPIKEPQQQLFKATFQTSNLLQQQRNNT